ncbi:Proteophosphoglycan ppg4 [Rhodotorula diobovata]|uniref:Proteophosphoglycan ppg4 n=1 Tax=Rhodotorula diobovata TaxID=5288 RepID=A0A5C5FRG7_9BASI|nr:Proteophosphoglycan ppg4 [Rhodotorula diobovata]
MASSAFTDEFTSSHGGRCFFVDVDPAFDLQVSDAATVLARSRPEGDRAAFIQDLADQATRALPPAPEPTHANDDDDDDDDEDAEAEPKKAQDTPETRDAKRQVVARLVRSLEGHRLEAASDREFEGLSNLVLALVLSHYEPTDSEYPSLVSTLADALTNTPSSSSSSPSQSSAKAAAAPSLAARYASLATLFNALPTSTPAAADLRLSLLLKLVAFAAHNDDLAVVAPALAKLEHWLAEWDLGPAKSDHAVAEVAKHLVAKGHAQQARELVASHLARSSAGAQSSSESAAPLAATLVALSLAAPDLRLVQLADLCAERVGQTVSYDEIARACGVQAEKGSEEESEEVEGWVIDAIRASLLLGRLSQPSRTLSVSRASPVQAFTPQHWATVQQRLEGWKASLARVRTSVDRALGASAGAGAGAAEVVGGRRGEQDQEQEQ